MRLSIAVLFCLTTLVSRADAQVDVARAVAELIDDETWLVARIDLGNFDLARASKLLKGVLPEQDDMGLIDEALRVWQKTFRDHGGEEIYLVYGGSDFPQTPCFLVPMAKWKKGADVLEIFRYLEGKVPLNSKKIGPFLAVGTQHALRQLEARKPARRDDLFAALDKVKDAPFQLVFSPSASARKVVAELVPELPQDLGGGPTSILTDGLKWFSLGIDGAPKYTLHLTVQASDGKNVEALAGFWRKLVSLIGTERLPESTVSRVYSKWFQRVRELLTPNVAGDRFEIVVECSTALPELATLGRQLVGGPERSRSGNNLKQIMLALHNYHDAYGHFPTDITDKNGKPILSWRVAILPYLDQGVVYQQFKLDEPWDSEHNKKLLAQIPRSYRSPKQDAKPSDKTTYLAPTGKGLVWEKGQKIRIQSITDGTSNTIAVVEADDDRAVEWSRPEDLAIDPERPSKDLLAHYSDGFLAALADGSVKYLKKDTPDLYGWFTRAGGEVLSPVNPKGIKK